MQAREDEDPSRWSRRLPVAALVLVGLGVATTLALVQTRVLPPWDPFFGPASTDRVLHSAFSRMLPIPDAVLGACAYAVELGLELTGGRDRHRTHPRLVLAFGALATLMAVTGIALFVLQAAVLHAFCTLCLASALLSLLVAALSFPEVLASLHALRPASPSHR